jgi:hypothetical protein
MKQLIYSGDVEGLDRALTENVTFAAEEISLPDGNPVKAVLLHRICDGVFMKKYSEETGVAMANVLLKHNAPLNTSSSSSPDSPLTAACSLLCDQLALLYLKHGAKIDHRGCHGGTALHWAAWCGRDLVVEKLVTMKPEINQLCTDFKSTPLFWAIHGYKFGGNENRHHQIKCARILLQNGADRTIPNVKGILPIQCLDKEDVEMRKVLES